MINLITTLISSGIPATVGKTFISTVATSMISAGVVGIGLAGGGVEPVSAADAANLESLISNYLVSNYLDANLNLNPIETHLLSAMPKGIPSDGSAPAEFKAQRKADPTRQKFQQIIALIKSHKNGEIAEMMKQKGLGYKQIIALAKAQKWQSQPLPQIMQLVAEQLVGVPYQAGLLDKANTETLLVYLDKFDCVLLVENVLALAQTIALEDDSFDNFRLRVQQLRYRGGDIDGYCSRLHYFTDWINDNQKRQAVENRSNKFSTRFAPQRLPHKLDFMSSHRNSYAQLKDDANFACIKAVEQSLAEKPIYYIPTAQIPKAVSEIKAGDIIAITTKVKGLDATHTGIAYGNSDGTIGLLHASPDGKVTISRNLYLYVKGVPESIGIMVVRPIDPRRQ